VAHLLGDAGEGADLGGEVIDHVVGGAELETEPQEYAYLPGYYAVFFYDPDGIKLEILTVPALAA